MGKRGSGFTHWRTNRSEPQEFESVRGRHSEKPEEIRDLLRDYFAVDERLELFAREPRGTAPADWDCWGLEVNGYFRSCKDNICNTILQEGKRSVGVQTGSPRKRPRQNAAAVVASVHAEEEQPPAEIEVAQPKVHLTPEQTWAQLHASCPAPAKRVTKHKPGCKCFCCVRESRQEKLDASDDKHE